MATVLVTGSAGLIGSGLTQALLADSRINKVVGIDNDSRREFFGEAGSTEAQLAQFVAAGDRYDHLWVDIAARNDLDAFLAPYANSIDAIVHCAAQPSHDWASQFPVRDFEINANGTLHILDWMRRQSPHAKFVFMSSNKVYSVDEIEKLPLHAEATRYDVGEDSSAWFGLDTNLPVGTGSRCLYGTSKLAGDLVAQEYGEYYDLDVTILRCSSMSGPHHAAVSLHGFLGYVARQVALGEIYTVNGFGGKQVRDTLHYLDVVSALLAILSKPKAPAVRKFNLGGGRGNACSVLEALDIAAGLVGSRAKILMSEEPRRSDFRWWITNNAPFQEAFPEWHPARSLEDILGETLRRYQ